MRTGLLLCTLVLGVGCEARDVDAPVAQKPVAQTVAALDEHAALAAKLATRIDASRLALGPLQAVEHAPPFEEGRALAALREATGRDFEADSSNPAEWSASDGQYRATLEPGSGRVHVRGGDAYDAALAHAPDEVFEARAAALLRGFAPDLPRELHVKHLGSTTRTIVEDDVPVDDQNKLERMGSKVYALRTLGGLPVAGNRLVASYRNDGQLVGVRGRWPEIDVGRSKLHSEMRPEDVVGRAADVLASRGVNPDREEPIVLESFYELRPDASGWVAVLRASAVVVTHNAEGEQGRRERHDFDI
jgi:hypothetical protein